ncbi:MAG TPA: BTAD domain-containing putative transcriptional regulator [Longimicrobiales bacterium]|nr:BTAD domain-containing putative transcriptional regulator [Longimicrobiales bacterium]
MLTLRAFGELDLRDATGAPLTSVLTQPKRSALLAYLLLSRPEGLHRRDALLALFWPELDQEHGRSALNQALTFLRHKLGEEVLVTRGGEEVGVDPSRIHCDVLAFGERVRQGQWCEALELYRGDLLEGLHVKEAPEVADWVDRERVRLREEAAGAAWRWAHQLIGEGKPVEAERKAQRALQLAPTEESPVREFIVALAGAGERGAALRFHEKFRDMLERELGVEPAPETEAAVRAVREGEVRGVPPSGEQGVPQPEDAPPAAVPVREVERKRTWLRPVFLGVGAVALVTASAWAWLNRSGPLPDARLREPVVVLPFEVRGSATALEALGIDAADRITAAMESASLGDVAPLASAGRGERFTERVGRRALRETGAGTLVVGTIAQRGDQVEVQAHVVRGSDLHALWTLGPERAQATEPAAALDAIQQRVLGAVGWYLSPATEHLQNPAGYQPPPNLEVLRLALRADELWREGRRVAAVPLLQEACLRDSTWLPGALRLARYYSEIVRPQARDSVLPWLEARRERLYPLDALTLNWLQAHVGSPEAQYRAALALYEADAGWAFEASQAALRDRRPEEALHYYALRDTTTAFGADWQAWDAVAAGAYQVLGRFEEELALARAAKAREPRAIAHWTHEVMALAALGRVEEIERVVNESYRLEMQGAPERLSSNAAQVLSGHGFAEAAWEFAQRAVTGWRQWPDSAREAPGAANTLRNSLVVLRDYEAVWQAYDEQSRRQGAQGLGARILGARFRILVGDTTGVLALVDSARNLPLVAFTGSWTIPGQPRYYGAQLLSLLGREAEAVSLLREALNGGWRLLPGEQGQLYWAPIKDYPPFQELMRLKDGNSGRPAEPSHSP